ncbi:MarR family winged helix-turn-helix transcriptional regulator [Paenibacillus sp. GCM10027629]|uniref:MarR family winged helix-turn-helix transcriptional regulator n=1 Tax=Paenibacillus sp. GCM10027629 TaxID=3273414 RepID=UPI0036391934
MANHTEEEQLTSLKLLVVLSKAYKTIMDSVSKDIRTYDLSPSEFGILEVLFTKGRIPLQQIGEKILITSGTMTYNIDKLVKKGWIARIPSHEDRRVIFAELTAQGQEFFGQIFPQHADRIHELMGGLSQTQKEEAIEMLKLLGKGANGK